MKPILTIGPIYCDVSLEGFMDFPQTGEELYLQGYSVSLGGNAIIASALAQLGIPSKLMASVGNDFFGDHLIHLLNTNDIGCEYVTRDHTITTNISIVIPSKDDRAFLTYEQDKELFGATVERSLEQIDPGCFSHIHISYELIHRSVVCEYLLEARTRGVTVSSDVGFQEAKVWDEKDFERLNALDYFFPNKDEALKITRTSSVRDALESLQSYFKVPIITLGSRGVTALNKAGEVLSIPAPHIQAVNTSGAGDSFTAGFLYGHCTGKSLEESLKYGVFSGSMTASSHASVSPNINSANIESMMLGAGGVA